MFKTIPPNLLVCTNLTLSKEIFFSVTGIRGAAAEKLSSVIIKSRESSSSALIPLSTALWYISVVESLSPNESSVSLLLSVHS